ncbi:MAG: hypothetical protein M3R37_12555 [Actinomycetota bacterium]|nr:hypothetical protein [Actinomycetota bacterium]
MTEQEKSQQQDDELRETEVEDENGELLPDREAMSIISPPHVTLPVEPPA